MNIDDLVQGDSQVASLPEIFFRLQEVIDDPDSSYLDVGEVISHDPSLSAGLLRIGNSAYFGFSNRITTISHAISIIGLDQLNDLVTSTLVVNKFKKVPNNVMNMKSFWKHSLACGLAARVMANHRKEPNPERFFLAGLLHDIGRMILSMKLPEKTVAAFALSQSQGLPLHEAETQVIGFNHAEVGGLLLKTWNLSKCHEEAVTFHHHPSAAPNHPMEAAVVHVADITANTLEIGSSGETVIPTLEKKALKLMKMDDGLFLSSVMREVVKGFEEASQVFLETTAA